MSESTVKSQIGFRYLLGCAKVLLLQQTCFLEPIDWITSRSVHRGFVGVSLGQEVFTDLDFADDVSLMAEMLEVLILALEIMNE